MEGYEMKCPDCKIEMEEVTMMTDEKGYLVATFLPIYKCPKCRVEIEDNEDIDNPNPAGNFN